MRKANVAIALLLSAIAVLVIVDAVRLGFRWADDGPQSGFFPFWLGVVLLVCAVIELSEVLVQRHRHAPARRLMPPGAWKPIGWVIAPAVGMVVATELVGLHVAAALKHQFIDRDRLLGRMGIGRP